MYVVKYFVINIIGNKFVIYYLVHLLYWIIILWGFNFLRTGVI